MKLKEEIAKVAYELYEKDGRKHGKDQEHWLEAERIVRARMEEQSKPEKAREVPAVKKASPAEAPKPAVAAESSEAPKKRGRMAKEEALAAPEEKKAKTARTPRSK